MSTSIFTRRLSVLLLLPCFGFGSRLAVAQPGNPGPLVYIDLGDVGIGTSVPPTTGQLAAGQVVWFRFRLTQPITPLSGWLDIDTAGPGTVLNPWAALYDNNQNLINQDDNGGGSSGSAGNGLAAAMSYGGGSGLQLSGTDANFGGGRISDGVWGAILPPGVYWIGVAASLATFPNPNPNWTVTNTTTASGSVQVRLATGQVPQSYWNERHHSGGDAGDTLSTAQVVEGVGPLSRIVCSFSPGAKDLFKIRICDPASFQATAYLTRTDGGLYDARLFILDSTGHGVVAINNTTSPATITTLTVPPGTPAGDYYLGVLSNCAGENSFAAVPYDSLNRQLWDFAPSGTANVRLSPNGPGAASPMVYWGRQGNCGSTDPYYVRIDLSGACHSAGPTGCPANFNGVDGLTVQDIFDFLNAWFAGCP